MARFEDAIRWVSNANARGVVCARRAIWADIPEYTRTTPPLNYRRRWHIWMAADDGNIIAGWGGVVGGDLEPGDPIRDGGGYRPTDEDRTALDWELWEAFEGKWVKR
jgi:hypothetical protein